MPEPIALTLGLAVAKAVFKSWFKDNEFASSISESITDLVGKVVPDWRAKSAAGRQLERISEKTAEAFEPLLEIEWRDLARGEKITAIYQVQRAIDCLGINARFLADLEFESARLGQAIDRHLDVSMLDAEGASLARRLASESAQLIVDISSTLPNFHQETFAEVLKREGEIIESIDSIFSALEKIRDQAAQASSRSASEFETSYRRAVARKLDRIELFGLNASTNPTSRQHALTTAYISLSVTGSGQGGLEFDPGDVSELSLEVDADKPPTANFASTRAEEAAAIAKRVVIKGEAGSGKTTLLQSLAVRCAESTFEDDMAEWNSLVPFFVSLRALAGNELPAPETFPSLVASMISGTMPKGWVHDQLTQGRGLLLVDGLDEISEQRRESTRKWLKELLDTYEDCRVVITTRPPAIPDGWLSSKGFAEVELLPMSPADVAVFIEHWHEAVAREERDQDASEKTLQLSAPLKERIRGDRALRELAATPLLCAMLCAMNRDRKEVLPSNRVALYEAAVQLILHGRDEQRQVRVGDLPILDFETKRDLLQEIAFWMMQNGVSMAEEWRVTELIDKLAQRFPRFPKDADSGRIVKSLLLRSGLLRSPVEGKCDFIHNAFKEFLCARAISDGDKFGFLEQVVTQSEAWREVAPMAAAITDDRRRTAFLGQLLDRGDNSTSNRSTYHLLAVRCLESCTQLDPAIQTRIRERIRVLRPPQSIGEAKALSAAGDLAIDLIHKYPGQRARESASCVRALRLIGSNAALEQLAEFGPDRRGTVVKELLAAWPFFDRREYARRVLSGSRGLWGGLRIDSLEAMEGVGYLEALPKLTVISPRRMLEDKHWAEIQGLSSLNELFINVNGKVDLSRLVGLQKLQSLSVSCSQIDNLDSLSGLEGLRYLDVNAKSLGLCNNFDAMNLSRFTFTGELAAGRGAIRTGPSLSTFFASDASPSLDLSFLTESPRVSRIALPYARFRSLLSEVNWASILSGLFLYQARDLESLEELPDSPSLNNLWLRDAENLKDISGLKKYPKMTDFSVSKCHSPLDFSGLLECQMLNSLTLSFEYNDFDIGPILELPQSVRIVSSSSVIGLLRKAGMKNYMRVINT